MTDLTCQKGERRWQKRDWYAADPLETMPANTAAQSAEQ
jgi:DNA-directed RNA polymerase delta subunit